MKIDIAQKDPLFLSCDLLVFGVFQQTKRLNGALASMDLLLEGELGALIESDEYDGVLGQTLVVPTLGKTKAKKIALIGLGDRKKFDEDVLRKLGGHIVKLAEREHASHVVATMDVLSGVGELFIRTLAQSLVEGLQLSAYRFHTYHGTLKKKEQMKKQMTRVSLVAQNARSFKQMKEGVERGLLLSEAACFARDLVNTPSAHMAPSDLVGRARGLVGHGIKIKVMDQKEMERLGMGAALAVARGSDHPPFGVHLSSVPPGAKKTVAIVGKAVTFDSGGLSLKPADSMMTMKCDMAGAASVLGLFKALSASHVKVAVHGIFLAVENMPSGSAYRPGDVVTAMDGTTIEVLNTDAEGRVTLADALCYAKTLDPDMIIDLATLTGACVVALGEDVAGLLTNDDKLGERLLEAAAETGEQLWELPLFEPYAELIKSKIADIKNIGGREGGAITAALFLKPFIGETPWAHLDIAGPSYIEKETRPDMPYGGSGYGVRLLLKFLQDLR